MKKLPRCYECNAILTMHSQRKYCGTVCYKKGMQTKAREGMRAYRYKHKNPLQDIRIFGKTLGCQVCSFDKVIDIHHEGDKLYALCPNHHALITRGYSKIKDWDIQPLTYPYGVRIVK